MSCNYADNLSPYADKGILGIPEIFNDENDVNKKCEELADLILSAKHVVVHTGAGISTSAGIPDFRGPNGVWTLERRGEKPNVNIIFDDAKPTKTHMALKVLIDSGHVKYIVSQNVDGLHMKSGISRQFISELHGNIFIENCTKCRRQRIRRTQTPTIGQKPIPNTQCTTVLSNGRICRGGQLYDNILDWEHDLPDKDLDLAFTNSSIADLNICLGSTMQINPSGGLVLKNKKIGGKFVICNLQPTKYDKKADLVINTYCDIVMEKILKRLGIELPEYLIDNDPVKQFDHIIDRNLLDWTIPDEWVKKMEKIYENVIKETKKRKKEFTVDLIKNNKRKKIKSKYENDDNDNDDKINN